MRRFIGETIKQFIEAISKGSALGTGLGLGLWFADLVFWGGNLIPGITSALDALAQNGG